MLNQISNIVQNGKFREIEQAINTALESGVSAKEILNNGLIAGMMVIGEKFKNNQVYVPEVLISARAMNRGVEAIKPLLISEGVEPVGKAIICTVKGDLHDIGKNLVKMVPRLTTAMVRSCCVRFIALPPLCPEASAARSGQAKSAPWPEA